MLTNLHQTIKVAILGLRCAYALCTYALKLHGLASEVVLINTNSPRAGDKTMDINQGSLLKKPVRIRMGEYKDCREAVINVLTAGTSKRPRDTRMDLLNNNPAILDAILSLNLEDCISIGRIPSTRLLLRQEEAA